MLGQFFYGDIEMFHAAPGVCISMFIIIHSKTFLNRPTMGPTLNGLFSDVAGLGS